MLRGGCWVGAFRSVCLRLHADPHDVYALIQNNCAGCHSPTVKAGDLDLVSLQSPKTFDEDRETWVKVVEKLKHGQMPPPGLPRPPAETVSAVTRWLEAEFARQDRATRPEAGRISARRPNRPEYNKP